MIDALSEPDDDSPDGRDEAPAELDTDTSEAEFAAAFQRLSEPPEETESTSGPDDEDNWPAEDLESAYRRALEANDSVEWDFSHYTAETTANDEPDSAETGSSDDESVASDDALTVDADSTAAEAGEATNASSDDSVPQRSSETPPPRIRMAQVVEAALFVGGEPLTSKRLCYMLKGDYDLDAIEQAIEELNRKYNDECRPYEIRLGEGGYRVVLRDEFNSVRNRVFGIGPREVKLSQDVLEVLALVAYRQPITQEEIITLGKSNPGGVLRQLLRRQIIELHRDEEDRKRVTYSTTQRFLSVFGIGSIDELPQADELAFK